MLRLAFVAARSSRAASTSIKKVVSPDSGTVTMTDRCVERIHHQNSIDDSQPILRLKVVTGGCLGGKYEFVWENTIQEDDVHFEKDGARLVINKNLMGMLSGSLIDFQEQMKAKTFQVMKPDDDSYQTCSCGSSVQLG
eukprot:TRINITY_DN755_c0_g1_i1.p1 TRINITY_DN755_c0_g1~~TRINITY_DN755_c0_g1_i1.p1  ORF type:complete len:138 (+),score=23.28 TRINITY_DN755_c0_g1_i1:50-463(+)